MNNIQIAEENNQPGRVIEHDSESSGKQAKITGLVCMACAATAIGLGIFNATLYFLFLFLAATFGLLGYSEIKAIGKGLISLAFWLVAGVLLIMLFLSLLDSANSGNFSIFYTVFPILVPVMLTAFALGTRKVAVWQALLPLSIPAFHIVTLMTANSRNLLLGLLLAPIGWGLLGLAAYLGRK